VKLYLPRAETHPKSTSAEPATSAGPLPHGTETILVVDDDEDVRHYSANATRHLGYQVLEADDGASAMGVLKTRADIKLLFTDVGLPGMSGWELADRARDSRPDLKFVFTSGYARSAIANLGLMDSGVLFLPKPFRIDNLAHLLRSALDAK
jgi:CheY-like chemotaxis protein